MEPNTRHSVGGTSGSGLKRQRIAPRGDETMSEAAGASSENSEGCEPNLLRLDLKIAQLLPAWSNLVKEVFRVLPTMGDLGRHFWELVKVILTPFGNFMRSFCLSAQPPTKKEVKASMHGDLLPIPPWGIDAGIPGVTASNMDWVKLAVVMINFYYCTAWAKLICVLLASEITEL